MSNALKEAIKEIKKWRDAHKDPRDDYEYHEAKYKSYDKVIKLLEQIKE